MHKIQIKYLGPVKELELEDRKSTRLNWGTGNREKYRGKGSIFFQDYKNYAGRLSLPAV